MQYVSCSWDQSIRVWNAWKKQVKRREPDEEGEDKETDKMKKVEITVEEEEELGEGQVTPPDCPPQEEESNHPSEETPLEKDSW